MWASLSDFSSSAIHLATIVDTICSYPKFGSPASGLREGSGDQGKSSLNLAMSTKPAQIAILIDLVLTIMFMPSAINLLLNDLKTKDYRSG